MRDADELAFSALLGSRFPVIVVETPEEARALHLAERVATLQETALYGWSVTAGIRRVNGRDAAAGTGPLRAWDSGSRTLGQANRMGTYTGPNASRLTGSTVSRPTSTVTRAGFGSTGRAYSSGG